MITHQKLHRPYPQCSFCRFLRLDWDASWICKNNFNSNILVPWSISTTMQKKPVSSMGLHLCCRGDIISVQALWITFKSSLLQRICLVYGHFLLEALPVGWIAMGSREFGNLLRKKHLSPVCLWRKSVQNSGKTIIQHLPHPEFLSWF
jgi:hypothetical protein